LPARLGTLLWAGLIRVTLLQHVTWSVNSLCHVVGARPFTTRRHDRAANLWPLALLSLGESWHNMHHSDPACVRHGADPRPIEISAAVIRIFERLGWPPACTGPPAPAWSPAAAIRVSTGQRRYTRQRGADLAGTDLTVNAVHCNVNNVARN
jgi:fatty-acid desaturase